MLESILLIVILTRHAVTLNIGSRAKVTARSKVVLTVSAQVSLPAESRPASHPPPKSYVITAKQEGRVS
ncbi:hypothetical protein RRG08_043655 [Elysia crispata]|uniref:Secreted protein n=1 Tax=Elysia crispata TaxID=231223 RepID=A0AAE0ZUV8_9GAST|nr:hypothetical protein RRG08_043655 [Elysia crispata]